MIEYVPHYAIKKDRKKGALHKWSGLVRRAGARQGGFTCITSRPSKMRNEAVQIRVDVLPIFGQTGCLEVPCLK